MCGRVSFAAGVCRTPASVSRKLCSEFVGYATSLPDLSPCCALAHRAGEALVASSACCAGSVDAVVTRVRLSRVLTDEVSFGVSGADHWLLFGFVVVGRCCFVVVVCCCCSLLLQWGCICCCCAYRCSCCDCY